MSDEASRPKFYIFCSVRVGYMPHSFHPSRLKHSKYMNYDYRSVNWIELAY